MNEDNETNELNRIRKKPSKHVKPSNFKVSNMKTDINDFKFKKFGISSSKGKKFQK